MATELNILLLGETGVGKSTFVNAFINYTTYENLVQAEANDIQCLIPSKFSVTDENFKQKVIEVGKDRNENTEIGESATQGAMSYVFTILKGDEKIRVRFIDTPGIGDTRGIEQDEKNMDNILSYLSDFKNLHAICILLKPNNARLTAQFEFCLNSLFCQLEKSASRNIIFVFTNSRGTFYRPGDTLTALSKMLENIAKKPPHVKISTVKDNMYCLDNEAFRFLAALKNQVKFTEEDKKNFGQSWERSTEECWRMLDFIRGKNGQAALIPHEVQNTISVNNARKIILQLSRPMAEITQLISENIMLMNRKTDELNREDMTVNDLKNRLFIPQTDVRLKELSQPVTVCTGQKCYKTYKVNGRNVCHYPQRCHNPCYLRNVPKEIIGSPELVRCAAMNETGTCKMCRCPYSFHQHIYYETELFENNIRDDNVYSNILTKEQAVAQAKTLIITMQIKRSSYESEKSFIIKSLAKFSHFLANNAITPYNDSYKEYFKYLIDRERALGSDCDTEVISNLQLMIAKYDEEKRILEEALNSRPEGTTTEIITPATVKTIMDDLYKLKNFGKKIENAMAMQIKSQEAAQKNNEYVHGNLLIASDGSSRPAPSYLKRGLCTNRGAKNKTEGALQRNCRQTYKTQSRFERIQRRSMHSNNNQAIFHNFGEKYPSNDTPYNFQNPLMQNFEKRPTCMSQENPTKGLLRDNTVIISGLDCSLRKRDVAAIFKETCELSCEQNMIIFMYKTKEGSYNGHATATFSNFETAQLAALLNNEKDVVGKQISVRLATENDTFWSAGKGEQNETNQANHPLEENTVVISGLPQTIHKYEVAALFKTVCEKSKGDTRKLKIWIYYENLKMKLGNGRATVTCSNSLEQKLAVGLLNEQKFRGDILEVRLAKMGETYLDAGQLNKQYKRSELKPKINVNPTGRYEVENGQEISLKSSSDKEENALIKGIRNFFLDYSKK